MHRHVPAADPRQQQRTDRTINLLSFENAATRATSGPSYCRVPAPLSSYLNKSVSADGKLIASASRDDTVRVWELETGTTLAVLQSKAAEIETDDAEPSDANSADSQAGELRFKDSRKADMLSVAFQANGRCLSAGGNDGKVRIWKQADFRLLGTFEGDPDRVYRVALHPTAENVIASGDSGIRAVNLSERSVRDLDEQEMVSQLAFHPQGNLLVSANASGEIYLIDFPSLETEKILRTCRAERGLDF